MRKQAVALPDGGRSRNIVARSPGPLHVVIVAHLDGVCAGPAANDNASGVAVMLELARALRGERGLLIAAVGAEERVETGSPVHLGSDRLARALAPSTRARVRLAVSLDMGGRRRATHGAGYRVGSEFVGLPTARRDPVERGQGPVQAGLRGLGPR